MKVALQECSNPLFKEAFSVSSENIMRFKGFFDLVLLTEVIEHLDNRDLSVVCSNIRTLLKPGGKIFITTPNNEDFRSSMVVCPDCGCYFHKVQHIRIWNQESLASHMNGEGFNEVMSIQTDINSGNNWKMKVFKYVRSILHAI